MAPATVNQSTPGRFPYVEPTPLPANAGPGPIARWIIQFVTNFRNWRRTLEQNVPTAMPGGTIPPQTFANGRFVTHSDGTVWFQLKDAATGLYHSVFMVNAKLASEQTGET